MKKKGKKTFRVGIKKKARIRRGRGSRPIIKGEGKDDPRAKREVWSGVRSKSLFYSEETELELPHLMLLLVSGTSPACIP